MQRTERPQRGLRPLALPHDLHQSLVQLGDEDLVGKALERGGLRERRSRQQIGRRDGGDEAVGQAGRVADDESARLQVTLLA